MAGTPYIHERQSEFWTSRQIEEFFLDLGFEVITLPLIQLVEGILPADFIFFDRGRTKLFGLQYKALYRNDEDYWKINPEQHRKLFKYSWVYYCLSEIKEANQHRIALHLSRIVNTNFPYQEKILQKGEVKRNFYSRWGAFYQGFEKCINGVLIKSQEHLKHLLMQDSNDTNLKRFAETAVDTFLADLDSKNLIHFSPFLRDDLQ